MSHPAQSDLGQEAGGGLREPCWAQTGSSSWRDEVLDPESFVSGHAPYDVRRKEPSTPMAEEIATSSRYHPPLGISGRSVDATTARPSDSEAQTAKDISEQLPRSQPPPTAPLNIRLSGCANLSRPSQEYFPVTPQKSHSAYHPEMEPLKQISKPEDTGILVGSPSKLEKGFSEIGIQADETEIQSVAWKEVRSLREEILGIRSRVHQKRDELREMERVKAEADNLLFRRMLLEGKGIRLERRTLPMGQKTLQQLMDDSQKARDEYGPKEDECISLEDHMSRLEFRLNRLEQPFFSRIEEPRPPLPIVSRGPAPAFQTSGTESVSSTDDEFDEPEYHPLVMRYLSKLGDLDLLHERRDNLVEEKHSLEEEKEKRSNLGMTLNPDDQAWLDGSQAEYDGLARDIGFLEKELVDLKADCLAQGFVDEHGEPTDFANLEAASFHNEEDMNPKEQTSEYVKHPILLPLHPGRKQEDVEIYEPELEPDETSENPTRRINDWMLKSLRMSPLNVNFLARIFEDRGGRPSTQWELAVLRFWFTDVSIVPSTRVRRAHASSLITETDISNSSTPKHQEENPLNPFFNAARRFPSDPIIDTELVFTVGNLPATPKAHSFRNVK